MQIRLYIKFTLKVFGPFHDLNKRFIQMMKIAPAPPQLLPAPHQLEERT